MCKAFYCGLFQQQHGAYKVRLSVSYSDSRSVCIPQVRNRSLSPNTVVGFFLPDSVVGMVHVNDQVPVVVVGRLIVGDHAAGDAQEAHH